MCELRGALEPPGDEILEVFAVKAHLVFRKEPLERAPDERLDVVAVVKLEPAVQHAASVLPRSTACL